MACSMRREGGTFFVVFVDVASIGYPKIIRLSSMRGEGGVVNKSLSSVV